MGDAAEQMAAAIAADGGAGLPAADAVPGSDGGSQPAAAGPPAGAQNTETATGGAPDTIPYARFKEVNDGYTQLKGFEPLVEFGYDPDSLGRLAAFEQEYLRDPIGVWASMTDNLDLPQELKDQITAHVASNGGAGAPGSAQGESSGDGAPALELPPEVQAKLDYVDQLQARESEAAREAQLDAVLSHWDKLDKQDEIETPKALQLRMVSAAASSGQQFKTIEELAEFARKDVVDYRSSVLGGAVRTGRTGAPLAVPGSASAPAGPVKFSSIRDATRAAEEAMKRGELPAIRE